MRQNLTLVQLEELRTDPPPGAVTQTAREAAGEATREAAWDSSQQVSPISEPRAVQLLLIGTALVFLTGFLFLPLLQVFIGALSEGLGVFWRALREPDAFQAIKLTVLTAAIAVPLNTVFGVCAAWAITRFRFFGRSFLISLIDLPFSVSPVVAGLMFVLLFGSHGVFGPWMAAHDLKVIFAVPGIVLATVFVTFPFVARELIPVMEAASMEEEEAALVLGASGWQTFFKVTVPNVKWGLIYGVLLCNARAMGEFGAVSVVSGHIRGSTNTIPLHVEILYNEYNFAAAFAVASLLALLAIITMVLRQVADLRAHQRLQDDSSSSSSSSSSSKRSRRR